MNTLIGAVAFISALAMSHLPAGANEGEWRWRIYGSGDALDMYVLDSDDAATDDLGQLRFSCKRASGRIQVEQVMTPEDRKMFADLIARNAEPLLMPTVGDLDLVIDTAQPSYSDLGGWVFRYILTPDERTFDEFRQSGTLRVRIGARVIEQTSAAGLDTVAKFQVECRKS